MDNNNQIIIYQTDDDQTQIDVRLENETVWLTQAQMAELFQTDRTSIVRHINKIYADDELDRDSTCAKIAQVQKEGQRTVRRSIPYFNLDMIISVGYRVNSKRGVKFRQWANRVLKQYLIKGYAINKCLLWKSALADSCQKMEWQLSIASITKCKLNKKHKNICITQNKSLPLQPIM